VPLLPRSRHDTVVVLDDDLSVCRARKMQPESLGFEVLVIHSAECLLASRVPTQGGCLLADVYLHGMNGIELSRKLKAEGWGLPTILMSGRDDPQTLRIMREAKPIARLFKPFDEVALLRAIHRAFRRLTGPES